MPRLDTVDDVPTGNTVDVDRDHGRYPIRWLLPVSLLGVHGGLHPEVHGLTPTRR